MEKIEVMQSIYDKNDQVSEEINRALTGKGIFAVNVMGAPGVGKTSVVLALIERMGGSEKSFVVEGDIESDFDTQTLKRLGIETVQINTHGACHLDAPTVQGAVARLGDLGPGILYIENIGNLVCPAEFMIGEHIKMLIVSTTDGSDKPYKYPLAFEKADIIVVNKMDLLPYVDFDETFFMTGVRALNPGAPVFMVSAKNGSGLDVMAQWLSEKERSPKA